MIVWDGAGDLESRSSHWREIAAEVF